MAAERRIASDAAAVAAVAAVVSKERPVSPDDDEPERKADGLSPGDRPAAHTRRTVRGGRRKRR
jgi:hypothetical protein